MFIAASKLMFHLKQIGRIFQFPSLRINPPRKSSDIRFTHTPRRCNQQNSIAWKKICRLCFQGLRINNMACATVVAISKFLLSV